MKKITLFLMVLIAACTVQAQKEFVVDANAEVRQLSGSFRSIKISDGIDLYLSQSDQEAIAVSAAEDKYKESIKTFVDNGTLKIYYFGDNSAGRNKKLRVYVSFKELEKLEATSASDTWVSGTISVPSLYLELSGASDFKGKVEVNTLKMELSGASDVTISGKAGIVKIESTGASDVKGYDLVSDICSAKASGASDIHITVNKEIEASASGASDIYFKGTGILKDEHSSGASSISKKG